MAARRVETHPCIRCSHYQDFERCAECKRPFQFMERWMDNNKKQEVEKRCSACIHYKICKFWEYKLNEKVADVCKSLDIYHYPVNMTIDEIFLDACDWFQPSGGNNE